TDAPAKAPVAPPRNPATFYEDITEAMIGDGLIDAPSPISVRIVDTEERSGMDFPGECAMYGKLKDMALKFPRLQLGWLYPDLLAAGSGLAIESVGGHIRSNLYVVNLGGSGLGKTACSDIAMS